MKSAEALFPELEFTTSRSSGPGGQHVNKVSTRVTLRFNIVHSSILTDEEKDTLLGKLSSRVSKDGVLILNAQDKWSQIRNKEEVVQKFSALITNAFRKRKVRKATKPSRRSLEKRIADKKQRSEKKKWRKGPE